MLQNPWSSLTILCLRTAEDVQQAVNDKWLLGSPLTFVTDMEAVRLLAGNAHVADRSIGFHQRLWSPDDPAVAHMALDILDEIRTNQRVQIVSSESLGVPLFLAAMCLHHLWGLPGATLLRYLVDGADEIAPAARDDVARQPIVATDLGEPFASYLRTLPERPWSIAQHPGLSWVEQGSVDIAVWLRWQHQLQHGQHEEKGAIDLARAMSLPKRVVTVSMKMHHATVEFVSWRQVYEAQVERVQHVFGYLLQQPYLSVDGFFQNLGYAWRLPLFDNLNCLFWFGEGISNDNFEILLFILQYAIADLWTDARAGVVFWRLMKGRSAWYASQVWSRNPDILNHQLIRVGPKAMHNPEPGMSRHDLLRGLIDTAHCLAIESVPAQPLPQLFASLCRVLGHEPQAQP